MLDKIVARLGKEKVAALLWPIQSEAMRKHYVAGESHDAVDDWYERQITALSRCDGRK
jgi:hypothetical protein